MTYSERGKQLLRSQLKNKFLRIHAIGNSTDTATLRQAVDSLTDLEREEARTILGDGARALFIGGLDASKNITQLLSSARSARLHDPSFKLVVVGKGPLDSEVEAASSAGDVVHIPAARGRTLAALASRCESIWMPGRVGLVAVDALALGLPVITVEHRYHAPEIDFLEPGEVFFVPSEPAAFAANAREAARHANARRPSEDLPSVARVAERMKVVILKASAPS
ncbi:glycosyltransferase [Curtobacterium flaccumfaciens]|nr:glycosyltransferase [Curtobacterium flaccumfaciens]